MFVRRAILRLRAAHALSFAMASGQKPDPTDLAAAGLDGVSTEFFDARNDGEERRRQPVAAATDAPLEPARWERSPTSEAA